MQKISIGVSRPSAGVTDTDVNFAQAASLGKSKHRDEDLDRLCIPGVIAHKAEYKITMKKAGAAATEGITEIKGHLVMTIIDTFDVRTFNEQMTLFVYYNDDEDAVSESAAAQTRTCDNIRRNVAAWEKTDGRYYKYDLQSVAGNGSGEDISGEGILLTQDGKALVTNGNVREEVILDKKTLFPIAFIEEIVRHIRKTTAKAAKSEQRINLSRMYLYDARINPYQAYEVDTLMTRDYKTRLEFNNPVLDTNNLWVVQSAFYIPDTKAPVSSPEFMINFSILPQGVITSFERPWDGGVTIKGTLEKVTVFHPFIPETCVKKPLPPTPSA